MTPWYREGLLHDDDICLVPLLFRAPPPKGTADRPPGLGCGNYFLRLRLLTALSLEVPSASGKVPGLRCDPGRPDSRVRLRHPQCPLLAGVMTVSKGNYPPNVIFTSQSPRSIRSPALGTYHFISSSLPEPTAFVARDCQPHGFRRRCPKFGHCHRPPLDFRIPRRLPYNFSLEQLLDAVWLAMASSLSPDQHQSQSSPEAASAFGGSERSTPAPLNLNFLKSLADKRATRGKRRLPFPYRIPYNNPPKRRGPKPDSKPALTRRQELNRQAQRTHRERKELYIKALEDEVLRLKELYGNVSLEKEKLVEANRQLRDALAQHGIQFIPSAGQENLSSNLSMGNASGTSPGTSFAAGSFTSFSPSQSSPGFTSNMHPMTADQMRATTQPTKGNGVDCEQAGIDFVLAYGSSASSRAYLSPPPPEEEANLDQTTEIGFADDGGFTGRPFRLEKPCMQHLPILLERAAGSDSKPCGHALMVSCPPTPSTNESVEASSIVKKETQSNPGQEFMGLNKADLATLLDLSKKLDLDGEITPVVAWGMILSHPRFTELRSDDIRRLAEELSQKVRCYGFGAVLEEFELRDAFESILPCDPETMVY
ncbi:hypothetical protein L249_7337 [Ophiocordyceps polyrhachis-furcata BCC 54312]|uniref:BZIP domain-containing protein n=1 Tax=Ophiocordyceps polyrhachis-furcata BCC 54312 TaxID=1330021 RepID=A0A367LAI0_9HYPO|nr:hypothetical protein L249_7337 [Ophiocordyceps polyrhachis-furcata BCC 54312]